MHYPNIINQNLRQQVVAITVKTGGGKFEGDFGIFWGLVKEK